MLTIIFMVWLVLVFFAIAEIAQAGKGICDTVYCRAKDGDNLNINKIKIVP